MKQSAVELKRVNIIIFKLNCLRPVAIFWRVLRKRNFPSHLNNLALEGFFSIPAGIKLLINQQKKMWEAVMSPPTTGQFYMFILYMDL